MHRIFLVLALTAASSMASADNSGFYGRALVGSANTDDPLVNNDTGFAIGVGWRFLPCLSVEAAYNDLGDFKMKGSFTGGTPHAPVDSLELGLASRLPFGKSGFFGQARIGVHRWNVDYENTERSSSRKGTDLYYGIGVGFNFNERFNLAANVDRYRIDIIDVEIDRIALVAEVNL